MTVSAKRRKETKTLAQKQQIPCKYLILHTTIFFPVYNVKKCRETLAIIRIPKNHYNCHNGQIEYKYRAFSPAKAREKVL